MNVDERQIDAIVHQVIGELRKPTTNGAAAMTQMPTKSTDCADLVLNERVVTLEALDGKLDGKNRVVVWKSAVVTPAVRDELRERDIELICGTVPTSAANEAPERTASASSTLFVAAVDRTEATAAIASIDGRALAMTANNTIMLVGDLCRRVSAGADARGVLLTEQPVAALCLANRHRHIRAAHAVDQSTVFEAMSAVGANVIVVDSRCVRPLQVKRIVSAVAGGERDRCPAELNLALEQAR
ncbi:MAG: RpiB/LacA/LacB family sugar-phosphate isomerase, partial [Pirellulales bacterium]|nr:RpiB/LacA/LacB family sugar-phosphate isomerase [Pirellulales bacterium]